MVSGSADCGWAPRTTGDCPTGILQPAGWTAERAQLTPLMSRLRVGRHHFHRTQSKSQGRPGCRAGMSTPYRVDGKSCGRTARGLGHFVMRPPRGWREVSGTITMLIAVGQAPDSPQSSDTSHRTQRGATNWSHLAGAGPHQALPRRRPATRSRAHARGADGTWGGRRAAGDAGSLSQASQQTFKGLLQTCKVSGAVLGSIWGLAVHRKTRTRRNTG